MYRKLRAAVFVLMLLQGNPGRTDPPALRAADPNRAGRLVDDARKARVAGHRDESRKLLEQALKIAPDCAAAHWERGELQHGGQWMPVQEFIELTGRDQDLIDYLRQRDEYLRGAAPIVLNYPAGTPPDPAAPKYLTAPATTTRYLRKTFDLSRKCTSARLHLLGFGNCEVFINGRRVLQARNQVLDTGKNTIAASPMGGIVFPVDNKLFGVGKNVIAVSLSSGKLNQVSGLYARLEGVLDDDRIFSVPSDLTWKASLRKADGWNAPEFDDLKWESVVPPPAGLADGQATVAVASPILEEGLANWCGGHNLKAHAEFHRARLGFFNKPPVTVNSPQPFVGGPTAFAPPAATVRKDILRDWERVAGYLEGTPEQQKWAAAKLGGADASAIAPFMVVVAEAGGVEAAPRFVLAFINEVLLRLKDRQAVDLLVLLAIECPPGATRRSAIVEALKWRSPLAYTPQLLQALGEPLEVKTQISQDGDGKAVCSANYTRRGPEEEERRTESREFKIEEEDGKGQRKVNRAESLAAAQRFAKELEIGLPAINQQVFDRNERVTAILGRLTGQDFGTAARKWWSWWQERYDVIMPPPKPARLPDHFPVELVRADGAMRTRNEGWARGTPVWTATGLRPIEELKPGDFVLARHSDTAELDFQIVVASLAQKPGPMLAIRAGDETVTATASQRLWCDGDGWCMARNLRVGDKLHGLHESLVVADVQPQPDQAAWKVVVAGFNTLHVGRAALLVHDTGKPCLTTAPMPGLQP